LARRMKRNKKMWPKRSLKIPSRPSM
jgi:hypothetical protein